MTDYTGLRRPAASAVPTSIGETARLRALDGLLALRKQLREEIPRQDLRTNLLLATWNIREFDSEKFGARCAEAYYYIAEIVSHFDLIAVQEVRADLSALKTLLKFLGPSWKFIVTDVTLGTAGNQERLAFLFDTRKVTFAGLAGELVLPKPKTGSTLQFARTPFLCGFQAGWCKFTICTVHIYYGKAVKDDPVRVEEIGNLAKTLAAMGQGGRRETKSNVDASARTVETDGENIIVLGDFNIFNVKDATFAALMEAGFQVPDQLKGGVAGNLGRDKHYDQIAFIQRSGRFKATGRAGVFDFQKSVFGDGKTDLYKDLIEPKYLVNEDGTPKNAAPVYNMWRTHQMSDHLLMWAEFQIDFSDDYLERRKLDGVPPVVPIAGPG